MSATLGKAIVEEKETAVRHDLGVWTILGESAEVHRSKERVTVAVTLEEATEAMSPQMLADVTGMKCGNVRKLLYSMSKAGEVLKMGYGKYVHPKNEVLIASLRTPGNSGNTGNTWEEQANG